MASDRLDAYRAKRDFSRTSEPAGKGVPGLEGSFVVQEHAARRLHYDFRLEVEGVMPSWAVPKGPSYDPKEKRLAVHVEDHPLDYQSFEGTIPAGEYGGGSVIVWDAGRYRNLTRRAGRDVPMREAINGGHVSVFLEGTKLRGAWSMTRTSAPEARQETWVLVKKKDSFARPGFDVEEEEPFSVRSGRRVGDVAVGSSEPEPEPEGGERASFRAPMLAQLVKTLPPSDSGWSYERKLDGLRALAVRDGTAVELYSRTGQRYGGRFGGIGKALAALPAADFVIDGEIVAFEGERTSFELLQRHGSKAMPVLVAFDLLHLFGRDTTELALSDRRRLLAQVIEEGEELRISEVLEGDPAELFEMACRSGWEGLMAKRSASPYRSGRSSDWRKLKCQASQELVVAGWTDPSGTRSHLGALLVGYFDEDGDLRYAGKVGTGFDEASLSHLGGLLSEREAPSSPFADAPRMKGVHWATPELVADVAFTEWTAEGRLRHPSFVGLRWDKAARDVTREQPA